MEREKFVTLTYRSDLVQRLEALSHNYYRKNKDRLASIVLAGSVAYGTKEIESGDDLDIILACPSYDLLLGKHFEKYLETFVESFEVNVGVYPVSRIKRERSLLMYDVKNGGKILAGLDIRPLIADIRPEDLCPYEAYRLLLNRLVELVIAVRGLGPDGVVVDGKLLKRVSGRIKRACVDSYLIFNRKYVTDSRKKRKIFFSLDGKMPKVRTFEQCRTALLIALEYGAKKANSKSLHEMIVEMKRKYRYPFNFRIYTLFVTKKISAILRSPIFDAYESALAFLESGETGNKSFSMFVKNLHRTWEKSPQPIIAK